MCACLGAFFPAPAGADDDRWAGRPAASPPAEGDDSAETKKSPAPEAKHKDTKQKHAAPGIGNLSRIESFGILTEPKEGGLGIDMWDGSDRTAITNLIRQLPSTYTYKTTRELARRVLLTAADVTMLRHKEAPEPGQDLLSLRIQKLMEMGALDDAAQLYKDKLYDPYDAAMANTGELALMYSGQSSLACLETKALKDRFKDDAFWQEMNGICDYLLGSMAGSKTAVSYAGNSAIIRQVMEKSSFRFAAGSIQEFETLTPREKALLVADKRIDYSKLRKLDRATFTPSTLMLLAHDSTAPIEFRFQLMLTAVREGIATPADLGAFYKAQTFARLADDSGRLEGIGDYKGWQRLAWLYKSAAAARGRINNAVLKAVLPLQGEYGLEALEPFAFMLSDAKPEGAPDDSIRTGILLALAADSPVSDAWAQQWKKNDSRVKNEFLVRIAYGIVTDSLSENQPYYKKLLSEINELPIQQQQLIKMLAEKLDKHSKLHNIGVGKVYENTVDLTQNVSYVMPSVGLMDSLATAVNDKHPGEVVLLSSISLHGVPPAKMFAGMLREVVGGFETVGLTKEARELAKEAILGLGK